MYMNKSIDLNNKVILDLIVFACIAGFVGDTLLQIGAKYFKLGGPTGWGLNAYFAQHGAVESIFIAGGMMTIFYVIYLYFLRLPVNYVYLAIYGIILDFIFRKLAIFPSLDGYYRYFNYFWSAIWGAIPLMLPLFIQGIQLSPSVTKP